MELGFKDTDLFLIAPMLVLFIASLIPLLIKVCRGNRELNPHVVNLYAFVGLFLAFGFSWGILGINDYAFKKALVFDGVSSMANLGVIFIGFVSLVYSSENQNINKALYSEYMFLLLNSIVGMMIVASSNDLIVLFIGIEMMSLCLYMLIGLSNEQTFAKESAIKYFVLGSFASCILLYGIAFVFGSLGTTYIDEITQTASTLVSVDRVFLFGVLMLIVGFAFKVGLAPFHAWVPDVYQGAPVPLTGFMATGVKLVTFVALLRWVFTDIFLGERSLVLINVLEWMAVFTMLIGNLAALFQQNFKRMLAYSGIAHSGYALVGLLAAGVGGSSMLGTTAVLFYVLAYAVMTLGTFGVVCFLEKKEDSIILLDDLKGLSSTNPVVSICLAVFLLSLAGIPPLVGFFSKFFIISAAMKQGFFWLSVWLVIASVISVYYYLKPIVYMYMHEPKGQDVLGEGAQTTIMNVILAGLVLILGVFAHPLYAFVQKAATNMFN